MNALHILSQVTWRTQVLSDYARTMRCPVLTRRIVLPGRSEVESDL